MIKLDFDKLRSKTFTFKKPNKEISADDFEELRLQDKLLVIDSRTSKEFNKFRILDSHNFPIQTNNERVIIGTMFKEKGQLPSVEKGWELLIPRMDEYLTKLNNFLKQNLKDKKLMIYCSRGGLRSGILSNLLELLGYKPYRLIGGFKRYKHVLNKYLTQELSSYNGKFIILEGLTGTRKTELLKNSKLPFLDLEGCAQHKSSIFGDVGLNPNSQKMFIAKLYEQFMTLKNNKIILLEGEANRIGDVFIPKILWEKMKKVKRISITASIKTRVAITIGEYCDNNVKVHQIIERLDRLTKYIGKNKVQELITQFKNNELEPAIEWLLTKYYDERYRFAKNKNEISISTDDLGVAIEKLNAVYEEFISN